MWWYLPGKVYGGKTTRTFIFAQCNMLTIGGLSLSIWQLIVRMAEETINGKIFYITMWWYLPGKVYGGKATRTIAMLGGYILAQYNMWFKF